MRFETAIIGAGAMVLCVLPAPAFAQGSSRFYAGVSVGSFRVSADAVSGTSTAAGFLAGFRVTPWLDFEGEVARPFGPFTRSYGGDSLSTSSAPQGSSREELERLGIWLRYDNRRDVSPSFSGSALFHPPRRSRVTPALIVGVTNHRVRDRTDYTPTRVGSGVDPNNPYARPHAQSSTRILGALTVGANVAVAVTRHLSVVPDLRYDYGSIGDEINNSLRMSVRMIWNF
jgi:hypothetical protein